MIFWPTILDEKPTKTYIKHPYERKMDARFSPFFALTFAIYYVFAFLFHEKLRQIGVRNNPKTVLFLIFSFCNLQQNALHLAAKHLAFCCRLHCVLLLNARYFAANCAVVLIFALLF